MVSGAPVIPFSSCNTSGHENHQGNDGHPKNAIRMEIMRGKRPPFEVESMSSKALKSKQKEDKNMQEKYSKKVEINKVEIQFTSKKMTAYGGLSLLASFFEKIKFKEAIEEATKEIEEISPNRIKIYDKIMGYGLTIYAGGERFSHLIYLGCKEALEKLFDIKRLPKASTTLTRMFGKIRSLRESEEISESMWGYLKKLIPWGEIKEDWLNFDSTVLIRYGNQEGATKGYNPKKKGAPSHNPLIGFLNKAKYVVQIWNRPGNASSGNNIIGFFDTAYGRLKEVIRVKGVIADSGFYLYKFLNHLEELKIKYIIAARLSEPLQNKIWGLKGWEKIEEGIEIAEFSYQPQDWKKERRYIVVRQDITKREKPTGKQLKLPSIYLETKDYRYSAWITNSGDGAKDLWAECKMRGNDENTIKELKEDFALGGFSLKYFYATETAMTIRVTLYNLFVLFRSQILKQKEKVKRLKTIRYKYFVIPGQLGSDGRVNILRISAYSNKIKASLQYLFGQIDQYHPFKKFNCNAVENRK
jgi:hypothetical protein